MRVLAVVSAALVAAGAGLVYLPAGLITAGVEGLTAAYVWAYLATQAKARASERRRPR